MRIILSLIAVGALTLLASGFLLLKNEGGAVLRQAEETYFLNLDMANSQKILQRTPLSLSEQSKLVVVSLPENPEFVSLGKWETPAQVTAGSKRLDGLELYLGSAGDGGKAVLKIQLYKLNGGGEKRVAEFLKTVSLKPGAPEIFKIEIPISVAHSFSNDRLALKISAASRSDKNKSKLLLYYGNLTVPTKVILK